TPRPPLSLHDALPISEDWHAKLQKAPIPNATLTIAVGIPADLLRRRPDVRRAERQAAAQSALIGVAEAQFYPRIALTGSFGYSRSEEHTSELQSRFDL